MVGVEKGASRSCTETYYFLNAARTYTFPGIRLLLGLRVGRRRQAVHVSQEMCCKAVNFRELLKSRFGAWKVAFACPLQPMLFQATRQREKMNREGRH